MRALRETGGERQQYARLLAGLERQTRDHPLRIDMGGGRDLDRFAEHEFNLGRLVAQQVAVARPAFDQIGVRQRARAGQCEHGERQQARGEVLPHLRGRSLIEGAGEDNSSLSSAADMSADGLPLTSIHRETPVSHS